MIVDIKTISRHSSIILIGMAGTTKHLKEIIQFEFLDEAKDIFKDCELVNALKTMLDMQVNISDIYLMNIENRHDFLEAIEILTDYEFTYIVPIGIHLSDFFYDPMRGGRKTFYAQYMLDNFSDYNRSILLFTDKHAALYETIDDYLNDMKKKLTEFHENKLTNEQRENVIFIANNIENCKNANAILAAMIWTSKLTEYPYTVSPYRAIFNIDPTDDISDMCYFKSHADGSFTVENLLNQIQEQSPIKIFTIYRICLYIMRELDYTKFIGTPYIAYKKKSIEDTVRKFLNSLKGYIIRDFKIYDISAYQNASHPGTVTILVKYEIIPIGMKETYVMRTLKV